MLYVYICHLYFPTLTPFFHFVLIELLVQGLMHLSVRVYDGELLSLCTSVRARMLYANPFLCIRIMHVLLFFIKIRCDMKRQ